MVQIYLKIISKQVYPYFFRGKIYKS